MFTISSVEPCVKRTFTSSKKPKLYTFSTERRTKNLLNGCPTFWLNSRVITRSLVFLLPCGVMRSTIPSTTDTCNTPLSSTAISFTWAKIYPSR